MSGAAPTVLDQLLGRRAGARPSGSQLKVNMVLRRLPGLRSGADPRRVFSGTVHVDEAASQIDAAYAQAAAGRLPDVIPFEVYCHSLTDPSIVGGTGCTRSPCSACTPRRSCTPPTGSGRRRCAG